MRIFAVVVLSLVILLAAISFYLRKVWFFRDPVRVPPPGQNLIVSPADGIVVYIKKFQDGIVESEKLNERIPLTEITKFESMDNQREGYLIGIYMSPFDVHFNYAPISGRVEEIFYFGPRFNFPMVDLWEYIRIAFLRRAVDLFSSKFRLQNERQTIFLEGEDGLKLAVVEIADKFVNKIDCYIKENQNLQVGQKIGFIKRGSQVDVIIFTKDLQLKVKKGDQVYGSKTLLARY